ncbi:MAG: flavodoxin family protein [Synergistaceae bacterium]|jgi:multimeric flavodoxin WrbA|nr:flavodoxin family protein [Synergistaceae bacterium]
MPTDVLIIKGSPRKGGNSDLLADAFAGGVIDAGWDVVIRRAADMKISGCLGCGHCFREKGVCVQKDDMTDFLEEYKSAKALAFASPIYYWGITAQLKALIDRTYALLPFGKTGKDVVLLFTCGDNTTETSRPAISMFHQIISYSGWTEKGTITAPGLHKPGEIKGKPVLERARELGKSFLQY